MRKLTNKQEDVFKFIQDTVEKYSRPPTIADICHQFGYKSNQSAVDHLNALHKKGFISLVGKSRGILINDKIRNKHQFKIIGNIAAGNPIAADEHFQDYFDLNRFYKPESTYVLRVQGNSMKNAGIYDGDFVFVHQQETVAHNEIGVAVINEEATVKRICFRGETIVLVPENEDFKEMVLDKSQDNFRIAGKVVGVFRSVD